MPGWLLAQMGTVQANIQGTDATCFDRNDGIFRVKLLAGTVPVIFSFKNNVNGAIGYRAFANVGQTVVLDSLFRGDYTFTFFEADGKKTILSGNLNSPPLLTAAFSAQGDKCFGENAGQLAVTSVAGGVNPYRYALDNNPAGTQSFWTNLTPGPYFLTVVDAVGCTRQAGAFLPVGTQFILDVGADTSIFSGDTLRYQLAANQVLASVSWSPSRYAQPIGADAVVLSPFSTTTFHAYATDTAGCVATDEVTVIVHRLRNVYLPNVFAPDSHDPVNRTFTVFTGGGVDRVESLRIFDQAARLMFLREQFAPNDPDQGWDGNFQGKRLLAGVFVYQAVVRYTDGRTEEFTGDLTLLR
ncbi:MAG: hypothetical protein ABIO24_11375 [Saprospiraceae bacterium]